jgi:hypothetical protein
MPMSGFRRLPLALAAALLVAACGRGGDKAAGGPAKMDTTNKEWEDGLSSRQVETEAKALSPEEAAQMGIAVDTSIHLEALDARDSVLVEGGRVSAPARGDSASVPVRVDSTP